MELYYTPRERNDLVNIKESVIEKFDDENLAIEVLKKITKTVRQLVMFPYLRQKFSGITGIYTEYRCLFCEKNYVFYRGTNGDTELFKKSRNINGFRACRIANNLY